MEKSKSPFKMASSLTVTTMSRFLARGHSGGRSFSALSRPAPTSERRTPLESSRSLSLVAIRESIRDCYLGIAGSSPVTSLCDSLCFFHDWSGMPWWGVLTVVSLGGRTALLLPAKVVSEKVRSAFYKPPGHDHSVSLGCADFSEEGLPVSRDGQAPHPHVKELHQDPSHEEELVRS